MEDRGPRWRLQASEVAERVVTDQHMFSHKTELLSGGVPEGLAERVSGHFYYVVRASLGDVLGDQGFVERYASTGEFQALSCHGAQGESACGDVNHFAIARGTLVMNVGRETYQQLGLEAPKQRRRRAGEPKIHRQARRVVTVDLSADSFRKKGASLRDRVLWCLDKSRVSEAFFLCSCVEKDGSESREIEFPSSVKCFRKVPLRVASSLLPFVLAPTEQEVSVACCTFDRFRARSLLEWEGLVACRLSSVVARRRADGDPVATYASASRSRYGGDEEEKKADTQQKEQRPLSVSWEAGISSITVEGFVAPQIAGLLIRAAKDHAKRTSHWCSLSLLGFEDAPVAWWYENRPETGRGYLFGGQNDVVSFVTKEDASIAICCLGAQDSFSGPF